MLRTCRKHVAKSHQKAPAAKKNIQNILKKITARNRKVLHVMTTAVPPAQCATVL